ncbi:fructose-bisphosphate aldolase class I [Candidatus Peregrinibacteria bacterium CG_4_9_14_0_2_um_filter_53_11]|nr:MAG: fructose-bisphosphate aldolase class I [Candidatus Peregrinibacteria bacterium CG_4_9_14_0_2_um_filter_53_11]
MNTQALAEIARAMVAPKKGILAADESSGTANKRLASIGVEQTDENRRLYRELFLSADGMEESLSGVILYDETVHQNANSGTSFVELLKQKGVLPGIKVDAGAQDMAGFPGEKITEGLDGLRERLTNYYRLGCRFAKWRAVITIGDNLPTETCIHSNAHALARYAALCQEAGIVPMVEPEVMIDGPHTLEKSEEVTTATLKALFAELAAQRVSMQGLILKSSMVISGKECPTQASPEQVAEATLRCFKNSLPAELGGIVFLSGGQEAVQATRNLDAINKLAQSRGDIPWQLTFSYARALQGPALDVWKGDEANMPAAREVFLKRLKCNSAAREGQYGPELEA